jgi:hypothetical protein
VRSRTIVTDGAGDTSLASAVRAAGGAGATRSATAAASAAGRSEDPCPPELEPEAPAAESIVRAFGGVMWEVLAGAPWPADDAGTHGVPHLRAADDVPAAVTDLVLRCCARAPCERPDMNNVVAVLEAAVDAMQPPAGVGVPHASVRVDGGGGGGGVKGSGGAGGSSSSTCVNKGGGRGWPTAGADIQTRMVPLRGHTGAVHSLAVLRDGRLASGSRDATIKFWDLTRERRVRRHAEWARRDGAGAGGGGA